MKVRIAKVNIDLSGVDQTFFEKRLREYKQDFEETQMSLQIRVKDKIKRPEGEIKIQIGQSTLLSLEKNNFCRYTCRPNGEIVYANYFNKDYTKVDIELLSSCNHRIFSLTDFEYMYSGEAFNNRLVTLGGAVLHGSAIAYEGQGIIFSATSGTGKSTHTGLWKEKYGDAVTIINDDKPAICFQEDKPYVFGTPWSGKTDLNTNVSVALSAIVFIKRDEHNFIERLNIRDSIIQLTSQIYRPYYDVALGEKTLDFTERMIHTVPVYCLHCTISQEAVEVVKAEIIDKVKG